MLNFYCCFNSKNYNSITFTIRTRDLIISAIRTSKNSFSKFYQFNFKIKIIIYNKKTTNLMKNKTNSKIKKSNKNKTKTTTHSSPKLAKTSNGRSSSSAYRPTASTSHSSSHYETSGSRSRESVRYRSAPYPKIR